jgi:hypothetical protein
MVGRPRVSGLQFALHRFFSWLFEFGFGVGLDPSAQYGRVADRAIIEIDD